MTADEKRWMDKLQAVLNECPSKRLEFYTTGDLDVSVFGGTKPIDTSLDMPQAIEKAKSRLGRIIFPGLVHTGCA
jgi:hypothetical protein